MNWHKRYTQQAAWTRPLRKYIFEKIGLNSGARVLEAGCGTGAVLSELSDRWNVHGLDLDAAALEECRVHAPRALVVRGDALRLPYPKESFDLVYSHFLLLWVADPLLALREMRRVARRGGYVAAFAEPNYLERVDSPDELIQLGRWQTESLVRQGADPGLGTRLAGLFSEAGITILETETLQGAGAEPSAREWEIEWSVIESDLAGWVPESDIQEMKRLDRQARQAGRRILHVPTHFAWGRV